VQYPLRAKGEVIVKLSRALHGCVQSSLLWYKKLKGTLEATGFVSNPYDPCVFNKIVEGEQITVAFHVDDLLVTSKPEAAISNLIDSLESRFTAVTAERGDKHSYLAMTIKRKSGCYTVDMDGYLTKLFAERALRYVISPATEGIFEEEENPTPLLEKERARFHSGVAKLLSVAKRVKISCLCAVSAMAPRVYAPTNNDQK
jgi:hypothetical protein